MSRNLKKGILGKAIKSQLPASCIMFVGLSAKGRIKASIQDNRQNYLPGIFLTAIKIILQKNRVKDHQIILFP